MFSLIIANHDALGTCLQLVNFCTESSDSSVSGNHCIKSLWETTEAQSKRGGMTIDHD